MESYSCFCCPVKEYDLKELKDSCPMCNNQYDFPLKYFPKKIGDVDIIKPLSRGYYGAIYIGEYSPFGRHKIRIAVKVIPVDLYKFHNKNFDEECDRHYEIASQSNHFVNIDTHIYYSKIPVEFTNGVTLECHAIGLGYIEGVTLKEYLQDNQVIPARTIGQIAIDLITILSELRQNAKHHNDLHAGNIMIESLPSSRKRLGELDENIKVVAIDLGSMDQMTKSNDDSNRIGDIHQVALILNKLSRKITDNPDFYDAKDWRLAFLLEEKADYFKPEIFHQKQITYVDIINQILDTIYSQTNPWSQKLQLKNFDDSVNAQSLRPWYIPSLIVDKNDNWLNRISVNGPQVITGMRGCGKTMLLRALEFHARIVAHNEIEEKNTERIKERLTEENYIGLYVSCVKLLDFNTHINKKDEYIEIFEPYSKLLIAYAIQAIYSVRHLKDIDNQSVRKDYFIEISLVLHNLISNSEDLTTITSDIDLEKKLRKYLNSLSDGKNTHIIKVHPKIAFPQLAASIKKSSQLFSNSYVYFLLDDVSTRYLDDKNIINLISELLFQDENCAFKFTTEEQTLEMVIMSPGNKSQAKVGRDYTIFNLGSEVNEIIRENNLKSGKEFIQEILEKRAKYYSSHPKNIKPLRILGDTTLRSIAEKIVKKEKASKKKDIYHGISAITAVCVGDLGDVITLYEHILRKGEKKREYPVDAEIQNQCFLELCNSRLYDLNRRDTRWLKFAEGFAEASHHLLLQSAVKESKRRKHDLRQYTTIFINITQGDKEKQYQQVRELIDAGIFTFQGGPEASRTNRMGVKPKQQFKLVFRKLYGLSKHIGLSNADRFELSGIPLTEWLEFPEKGKDIIIRNLNPLERDEIDKLLDEINIEEENSVLQTQLQFIEENSVDNSIEELKEQPDFSFITRRLPSICKIDFNELIQTKIDILFIGLGFEESTYYSATKLSALNPEKVFFVKFDEKGMSEKIKNEFISKGISNMQEIEFEDLLNKKIELRGNILCDITGLPKSFIFLIIRSSLIQEGEVFFSYTEPKTTYPLNEDIEKIFVNNDNEDTSELLRKLSSLVKGETGKYSLINLLPTYVNFSEPRVLFSFASSKHERLYSLLDERVYEKINIVVPDGESYKDKLSQVAADFALRKYNNATIHKISQDSIINTLDVLSKDYYTYFLLNNYPFEIALTGSKMQTVSAAIFSSVFKISQCWYVQPEKWDEKRFSHGFTDMSVYKVTK